MKIFCSVFVCVLVLTGCQDNTQDAIYNHKDDTQDAIYTHPDRISSAERNYFSELEKQAEAGSQEAAFKLVFHQQWMKGNYKEAIPSLEELANGGSMEAAEILNLAYQEGRGVVKDEEQTLYWLRRAVALGSEEARTKLQAYESYLAREIQN